VIHGDDPFVGYNMGDYFSTGSARAYRGQAPAHLCVNWFRTDASGKFIWPGFGENMRVLNVDCRALPGKAAGGRDSIGHVPGFADLEWKGLEAFRWR